MKTDPKVDRGEKDIGEKGKKAVFPGSSPGKQIIEEHQEDHQDNGRLLDQESRRV
jgi:hypothetical protein